MSAPAQSAPSAFPRQSYSLKLPGARSIAPPAALQEFATPCNWQRKFHPHPEYAIAEPQVAFHPGRGKPKVGTVNIIDDVQDEEKRKEAESDVVPRPVLNPGLHSQG